MDDIVATRPGKLRGSTRDGIRAFKGVPYALPPFGPGRLQPPRRVPPWQGVRDALAFGPKSPQPPYPPEVAVLLPELSPSGEDCLTLNIWCPGGERSGRPVMVWIAGGLFEYHGTGASPWYDGSRFARDGIVCITINYRVGAEGFLYLDDGVANLGLLDQVAALTWVQENIAAFGGDPGNVTVFGESAGAMSVGTLLSMPRAGGLFRRAIAQSGAAHHVNSAASAWRLGRYLAAKLGVEPNRSAIGSLPVNRLLRAQAELREELIAAPDPARWGAEVVATMLPWQPVIDGQVVPARPIDRIVAGAGADVDLMVGTNADEWRLFVVPGGLIEHITDEVVAATLATHGLPVESALARYRAELPGASAGELFAAIQTDWYWRIPAVRLAEAHAANASGASTCMYEFAWRSPQFGGQLGACHALEVPFVFDTLGHATEALHGPHPPQALADAMHAAWVTFAQHGGCGWPGYEPVRRATMRFDTTSSLVNDPRPALRELWEGVR
jgi:para-nitrobenzyl esterase